MTDPLNDDQAEDHVGPVRIGRRALLTGAAAGAAAIAVSSVVTAGPAKADQATQSAARRRPTGLPAEADAVIKAWAAAPSNHPQIGDWRYAGYGRGLSKPSVPPRVMTATSRGVRADQGVDVSGPLQAALDQLGASGGGVLRLQRGRYVLDKPLFIRDSNVVLQGAGKDQTTLYFSRPLNESVANTNGAWSWTGGQIFFIARERFARSSAVNWNYGAAGGGPGTESWLPGNPLTAVAPALRGTDVLVVDDSSKVPVGQMVLLEVDNPADYRLLREIAGDIAGAYNYDWAKRAARIAPPPTLDDFATWTWPVVVTEVLSSRTVRIEQPLRLTIHRGMGARLRPVGPTVSNSGVEDLTIENKLLPQTTHNINPGSNGVCFQAVHDCWARNIHVLNADVAFAMTAAKSCHLSGISAGGRSLHHFVACRVLSHDNLVEDFTLENFTIPAVPGSYLHGINVEGFSSGNVYRRGTMSTGTFDSHRQLPFENLRTDITITNKDAIPGGATDAGPYFGARTVHWGIKVTNNQNLCMDISDIAPRSVTVGITGLTSPGSVLGARLPDFPGDLESERIAFGTDLGRSKDLLDLQRTLVPIT